MKGWNSDISDAVKVGTLLGKGLLSLLVGSPAFHHAGVSSAVCLLCEMCASGHLLQCLSITWIK